MLEKEDVQLDYTHIVTNPYSNSFNKIKAKLRLSVILPNCSRCSPIQNKSKKPFYLLTKIFSWKYMNWKRRWTKFVLPRIKNIKEFEEFKNLLWSYSTSELIKFYTIKQLFWRYLMIFIAYLFTLHTEVQKTAIFWWSLLSSKRISNMKCYELLKLQIAFQKKHNRLNSTSILLNWKYGLVISHLNGIFLLYSKILWF